MLRRPLGRGLDALIENTLAQPPVSQMTLIRLDEIAPGPYQPRTHFDPERLAELAQAIKSQGIIEPLIVRFTGADGSSPKPYQLIAGERRLRAARLVGLERVPASFVNPRPLIVPPCVHRCATSAARSRRARRSLPDRSAHPC